jgi:hypothetical protein
VPSARAAPPPGLERNLHPDRSTRLRVVGGRRT